MTDARPGMLLIISGPSGVGKTTITHALAARLEGHFSVSLTTRPRTPSDREGVDYRFVTRDQFLAERDVGGLLEWAEVFGNLYGTPRAPVEAALRQGGLVILEIDVQGAEQIKANLPEAFGLFVLPPDEATLLARLQARQREDAATIAMRFAKAKDEIERAKRSGAYDVMIVNDQLDRAIDEAVRVVEQARLARQSS